MDDPESADYEYVIGWKRDRCRFELHVGVDQFCEVDRWTVQAAAWPLGFLRWSLRKEDLDELAKLLQALDQILKESSRVRDVRWFPSYDAPGELERQAAYEGPTSDSAVYQPERTPVERLADWHARLCAAGLRWCFPVATGGIVLFVATSALGFPRLALAGALLLALVTGSIFVALGTRAWLHGVELFQVRHRDGQITSAWTGLLLLFVGGAFFVLAGAGAVWGVVSAWLE